MTHPNLAHKALQNGYDGVKATFTFESNALDLFLKIILVSTFGNNALQLWAYGFFGATTRFHKEKLDNMLSNDY